jgi:hypothetical protein
LCFETYLLTYRFQYLLLTMNLKQSLHSQLADKETAEVITQLRSLSEESLVDLKDEIEQVAARFEANIEQSHGEFADELSTNKENARIRYLLLSIINRLPDDAELPSAIMQKRSKMAALIVLGVAILALIAFNFDLFKKEEPIVVEKPVIEQPKLVIARVEEQPKVAVEPVVAPITSPPVIVDSVPKVDTLRKKRFRRIKKTPVITTNPIGISQ